MSRAAPSPAPKAPAARPQAQRSALKIGRVGDAAEMHADRVADQALGGATPPSGRASFGDGGAAAAPRALDGQIAAARGAGRPLAENHRDFFSQRFGHDFRQVRIHDGAAAAKAARTAGAQAFTLGHDIYFGEGRNRPDSAPGRELMAHELAHTLQSRPGVISRRALDGAPSADQDSAMPEASPEVQDASRTVGDLMGGGAGVHTPAVRERLRGLSPEDQGQALGHARARLPAGEAARLDSALGAAAPPAQHKADSEAGGQTPPLAARGASAPVTRQSEPPDSVPPVHERALSASTSSMQAAVQAIGGGATPTPASPAVDAGEPDQAGAAPGGATGAAAAMQAALGRLSASRVQLEAVQGLRANFQQDDADGPPSPESAMKHNAAQSLADAFVARTVQKVQALLTSAMAAPGRAVAAFNSAAEGIRASAASQGAALKAGGQGARKKIRSQRSAVRGTISQGKAKTDSGADEGSTSAKRRAKRAHDKAAGGLGKRSLTEKARIVLAYRNAVKPMEAVGATAAQNAATAAQVRSGKLLARRNGESTVLDGPVHDDRLEADAEAGIKVAEEYGKSFRTTAQDEARKIPESRGEILGKVDEITTEARKGFSDQLQQIQDGATAQQTGAKAQAAKSAEQMTGSLEASTAQALAGVDAAETQQAAGLAQGAAAAQAGLDEAIAGSIQSFADGVGEAADSLTGSIGEFVASTAETPAPEPGELAQSLAGAAPDSALADMMAQTATVAPQLAASAAEAQKGSAESAANGTAAALQGFEAQAKGFAAGAVGIGRSAKTGFEKMQASIKASADEAGKTAEDGFDSAVTNANAAYQQFGDQVEDNFRQGRTQLLDGLWSKESQGKLDHDMQDHGAKAAAEVKPRWKKALKWVVTIVVILAVIAITVATAGALGPVGVILLGAALGAAAGAVQTIAENLIDGKKWSDGVVKAMIVGAIGGAAGGAGGVLLKGVGSVALKITLDAGINIVGGVVGEVVGSLATGQQVSWTGALMGALIGAGIGAGLGIAGALKGKIRIGGAGAADAGVAPIKPPAITPPPSPSTGLRGALEKAKILAPRPGAVSPPAVRPPEAPAIADPPAPVKPKEPIGFKIGDKANAPAVDPMAAPAPPKPKEPIGFKIGDKANAPAVDPMAAPAPPKPKEPIGFKIGDKANAPAVDPMAAPAPPKPKEPIGFKIGDKANAPAVDPMAAPAPQPRRRIGFGGGEIIPEPVSGAAPSPRRQIGFGRGEVIPEPVPASPTPSAPSAASMVEPPRMTQVGGGAKAMVIEPSAPRMGSADPIRAGGRSSVEPRASATSSDGPTRPPGGASVEAAPVKPRVVEPSLAKPAEPSAKPASASEPVKPKPKAPEPAAPSASPEPVPAPKPKRRIIVSRDTFAKPAVEPPTPATAKPTPAKAAKPAGPAKTIEPAKPVAEAAPAPEPAHAPAPARAAEPVSAAEPVRAPEPSTAPTAEKPTGKRTPADEQADWERWVKEQSVLDVDGTPGLRKPQEKLVAARVEGGGSSGKGTYWEEGSARFKGASKNDKFVVMPESQAKALKFRPAGTAYDPTIQPTKRGGVQVESSGAGSGSQHNVTARAKVQAGGGSFDKTIGASRTEAHGYKELLKNGELGITRPGNASTGGVDAITVKMEGGKAKIFLNDFTGPATSKSAKATHADWIKEVESALADPKFGFGDPTRTEEIKKAMRAALDNDDIFVRTTRVEYGAKGVVTTIETPKKIPR
ncbi:eCIS core domain-containing protein [Caulobacter endophyticus]|uniref:eCIS core domain-containing protein n=1 Tax=Caulobacter endophyticus TaxID=2172652 RepID=A0A2T9JEQ3_9CAUL|nr:DUF4157 domain-containing protein [Caulobacter endophyticus]PVM82181.1 hypothetical protein DDF67_24570 [Caulobacter endophyticus]